MTLTDFLLARIAEDEMRYTEAAGDEAHQQWAMTECPDYNEGYIVAEALRMLAECEAKRRIVESSRWVINQERVSTGMPGVYDRVNVYAVDEDREEVLQFLALPYADHPDYDEEWRP